MGSPDRTAVVRDVMARWARGDWRAGSELLTEDAIVSWQEPPADLVVCRGPAETAERLASFLAQWREFRVELRELEPLGDDAVLVKAHQFNVGKASGVLTDRPTWVAWRFDGARVTQIRWNWDRDEALAAAGLA